MNALELADYLDDNVEAMLLSEQSYLDKAAMILRLQQSRIEELENALIGLCVKCRTDLDCEGNSKQIINWVHDYCSEVL